MKGDIPMNTQLKRGILDICVLASLRNSESYGYKIVKDVSLIIPITESTLYPILKRLENNNSVLSYSVEHNGRLRKYYKITDIGLKKIDDFLTSWQAIQKAYEFILGEESYEQRNF